MSISLKVLSHWETGQNSCYMIGPSRIFFEDGSNMSSISDFAEGHPNDGHSVSDFK